MDDKLTLAEELACIDMGSRRLWSDLSETQRKALSVFVLNRYASSVKSNNKDKEALAVLKTNEFLNKNFWVTSKHPVLQWHLLCMCDQEDKNTVKHEWIKFGKKTNTKISAGLEEMYPNSKYDELELLSVLLSDADIKDKQLDMGIEVAKKKKRK